MITLERYHVQVAREELEKMKKDRDDLKSELVLVKEELRTVYLQLEEVKAVCPLFIL